MKQYSISELKGMTQEDLVRLAQEQQEEINRQMAAVEKAEARAADYQQWWTQAANDLRDLKKACSTFARMMSV